MTFTWSAAGLFSHIPSLVFLLLGASAATGGIRLPIKVVEAPTNLGVQAAYQPRQGSTIKLRVPPTNFSGPEHLRYLHGRCFSKEVGEYRYNFCPYENVTQHEVTLRWNSYNGVLGVWRDWSIVNNTFTTMNMEDGDTCGGHSNYRSTRIILRCGNTTEIFNITEPSTCHYELTLLTPLTCHPDSLLVYPTLTEEQQNDWDDLETSYHEGDLTRQGYDKGLRKLFIRAGLVVEAEEFQKDQLRNEQRMKLEFGQFESLMECQNEYRKLRSEFVRLNNVRNETTLAT